MRKLPGSFLEIGSSDYRWPERGDRLLRRSDSGKLDVEFVEDPNMKHVALWDGYLSAARGLIDLTLQDGYQHERHTVIYPILFNYRHGLELAMKWMILHYDGSGYQGVFEDHDLLCLWQQCKAIIEGYGSPDPAIDAVVERVIKDFHELDKSGVNLRYGLTKGGSIIRMPKVPIDLENIRDVMDGITSYFDGLDGWLSELQNEGP